MTRAEPGCFQAAAPAPPAPSPIRVASHVTRAEPELLRKSRPHQAWARDKEASKSLPPTSLINGPHSSYPPPLASMTPKLDTIQPVPQCTPSQLEGGIIIKPHALIDEHCVVTVSSRFPNTLAQPSTCRDDFAAGPQLERETDPAHVECLRTASTCPPPAANCRKQLFRRRSRTIAAFRSKSGGLGTQPNFQGTWL